MTTVTQRPRSSTEPWVETLTTEDKKFRPVVAWAVLGAGFVSFLVYLFTTWVVSGDAKPTPTGPDAVPAWMEVAARTWEVAGLFAFAFFIYRVAIRPRRQQGSFTLDGLLCFAFFSIIWQDTLLNYFQPWFAYNSTFLNHGAWDRAIPGWLSQNPNLNAEPHVWLFPIYVYLCLGAVMFGCYGMKKVKQRWPGLGPVGLIAWTYAFFMFFDLVLEAFLFMRMGFYVFPGAIEGLTLFHGKYYQFPIYESVIWGSTLTALACLRYFRNDRGETFAERGIDRVGVSGWKKTAVRALALAGACNLLWLVTYSLPAAVAGIYSDEWPKDITSRSYFTYLCGEGTEHACPGPAVPIPRPDSAHLDPAGNFVGPR